MSLCDGEAVGGKFNRKSRCQKQRDDLSQRVGAKTDIKLRNLME